MLLYRYGRDRLFDPVTNEEEWWELVEKREKVWPMPIVRRSRVTLEWRRRLDVWLVSIIGPGYGIMCMNSSDRVKSFKDKVTRTG